MKLGPEGYSPALLGKIEYAGGNSRSFACAAASLERLAECPISGRHVQRLTEKLGRERAAQRDADAAAMEARTLRSGYKQPPAVAVVMLDAGKAQFRQAGQGPGVHGPHWGDTKVACLQTYTDMEYAADPQPDPPAAFLDPARVERLCREMERVRGAGAGDKPPSGRNASEPREPKRKAKGKKRRRKRPERLVRTVVATTAKVEPFGWMVSAEAMRRKMYAAPKRAVIGDGGNWIEPLGRMHFAGWEQVLDFLHLLVHLFAAARLAYGKDAKAAWTLYERMLRDAWGGRTAAVIATLQSESARMAAAGEPSSQVVALTLGYVQRNRERMDYPRYRTMGLPVSSSLVESLIKQVNLRVKGTEQFWTDGGLEAVLQVRAAYLSEDGRAEALHQRRPRSPAVGSNRAKLSSR